ncbi:hypothetical protein D3C77_363080 [compost metagenome]
MEGRDAFARSKGLLRVVYEVPDDAIFPQCVRSFDQILPHQEFGEREGGQGGFVDDLQSGHIPDRSPNGSKQAGHVDAIVVERQVRERMELQVEFALQKLEQGRVEAGFVLVEADAERRTGAAPLEFDGHKEERSAITALIFRLFLPAQEADGQEERIGPAFRQVVTHLTVQVDQPRQELSLVQW